MNGTNRIGAVKFILLHHDACPRDQFHFRVDQTGATQALKTLDERGQHPNSIGIVVSGDFDESIPEAAQLDSLKQLIVDLKLQYPDTRLGAHRQVRGDTRTTCPGKLFPMKDIAAWFVDELPKLRDQTIRTNIEEQYGP